MSEIPTEVLSDLCSPACIKQVKNYREHNKTMCEELNYLKEMEKRYQRAIESLENQIKAYQDNETVYSDKIAVANWERDKAIKKADEIDLKNDELKIENDQIRLTIKKYDQASKTVDEIIKAQIHCNDKSGLGYNSVAPPFNQNYIPPKFEVESKNKDVVDDVKVEADPQTLEPQTLETQTPVEQQETNSDLTGKNKSGRSSIKKNTDKKGKGKIREEKGKTVKGNMKRSKSGKGSMKEKDFVQINKKSVFKNNQSGIYECSCSNKDKSFSHPRGNQRNWNQLMVQKYGPNFFHREERRCYICGKSGHIARNCFHNKFAQQNKNDKSGVGFRRSNKSPLRFKRNENVFVSKRNWMGSKTTSKTTGSTAPKTTGSTNGKSTSSTSGNKDYQEKSTTGTSTKTTGNRSNKKTSPNSSNPKSTKDSNKGVKMVNINGKMYTWIAKQQTTTGESTSTSSCPTNADTPQSAFEWKNFSYINEHGQPKTTIAWVPKRN